MSSHLPASHNMFLFDLEFARSSCIDSLVQPRGLASRESWCGSSNPLGVIDWGHRYPSVLHCKWILTTVLGEILGFVWFYIVLFVRFVESMGVWWSMEVQSGLCDSGKRSIVGSRQLRNSSTSLWVLPPASFSLSSIMKPSKNYELGVMTFCCWNFLVRPFSGDELNLDPWRWLSREAEPRCHGAMTDVGLCLERERWLNEVPKAPWWRSGWMAVGWRIFFG